MRIVGKYLLPIEEEFSLELPVGAEVIRVDGLDGHIYLWATIDTDVSTETRKFYFYKTGGKMVEDVDLAYLGCGSIYIQMELMLYLFEELL